MDDRELVVALEGLGLGRDNHRAVVLLPLIEVAWADGKIQRAERRRIKAIAKRYRIEATDAWLDRWLTRRPSKKAFLAAHTTLLALMTRYKEDFAPIDNVDALLRLCTEVASAAGGLFGLAFTVSAAERECIEQIAASLALGPALPEPVVVAWKEARDRRKRAEAVTSLRPPKRGPRYGILDQTTLQLSDPNRFAASNTSITAPGTAGLSAQVIEEPTDPFDAWIERTGRRKPVAPPPPPPFEPHYESSDPVRPHEAYGAAVLPTVERDASDPVDAPNQDRIAALPTVEAAPRRPSNEPGKPVWQPVREPIRQATIRDVAREPIRVAVGPQPRAATPRPADPRGGRNRRGGTAVPERGPEDDPTLPFFDQVNVGTYALEPDDDR